VDGALARYEAARRPRQDFVDRLSHGLASLLTGTSATARAVRRHELRVIDRNERLRQILTYNMAGCGVVRFTGADRLAQAGLPRSARPPATAPRRRAAARRARLSDPTPHVGRTAVGRAALGESEWLW
jgi:hypothetical protein